MLSVHDIDRIAAQVVADDLPPGSVLQVSSESDTGTDGEATLRVLVLLRATSFADITGAHTLHALSDLQDRLRAEGEARFASIEYATDEELATNGGS